MTPHAAFAERTDDRANLAGETTRTVRGRQIRGNRGGAAVHRKNLGHHGLRGANPVSLVNDDLRTGLRERSGATVTIAAFPARGFIASHSSMDRLIDGTRLAQRR